MKRMLCIAALAVLCLCAAACRETPTVTVDSGDATQTDQTLPTVAVPDGQMTISALMGRMGPDMTWSSIAAYTHTDEDASHAVFQVADTYGKECTLRVTYDAQTDTVSEATLSYKNTTVSVMTNDTMVMRTIMVAMNNDA